MTGAWTLEAGGSLGNHEGRGRPGPAPNLVSEEAGRRAAAVGYFSAARYPANASSSFLDNSWAGILLPG
jgi:hypothetical protein